MRTRLLIRRRRVLPDEHHADLGLGGDRRESRPAGRTRPCAGGGSLRGSRSRAGAPARAQLDSQAGEGEERLQDVVLQVFRDLRQLAQEPRRRRVAAVRGTGRENLLILQVPVRVPHPVDVQVPCGRGGRGSSPSSAARRRSPGCRSAGSAPPCRHGGRTASRRAPHLAAGRRSAIPSSRSVAAKSARVFCVSGSISRRTTVSGSQSPTITSRRQST